jgi:Fe-S cluster assembly protein SufD
MAAHLRTESTQVAAPTMPPATGPTGIDWLDAARAEAWAVYRNLPLPDRAAHLWRYTDPKEFVLSDPVVGEIASQEKGSVTSETAAREVRAVGIDHASRNQGVEVLDLREAAGTRPRLVREHLGRIVPATFGKPEALNAALWSGGFLVRVPRGVRLAQPIRLTTTLEETTAFRAVRNLIVIEEGANATIVVESRGGSTGGRALLDEVTEAFAAPGARLHLVSLQHLEPRVISHRTVRTRLDRDAVMQTTIASFGGALYKADIGTLLEGKGADSRILGFCFADGRQRADHHTVHDHRSEHTTSDINFRVVLSGRARSAYTGLIRIAQHAPYCEAFQENRNLLLSEESRAESIPELEILTDEVRCTHGATAGPIDPEEIFYLASRGLTPQEATKMIVGGFLEETIGKIPEEARESIREEFSQRLMEIGRP